MARTKNFDKERVVEKAMLLFLDKGYHATSIDDLVKSLGINRASMYSTFTDKHNLFLESLKLYEEKYTNHLVEQILNSASIQESLRFILETIIRIIQDDTTISGCLIVNTTTELALADEEIKLFIQENQKKVENALVLAFTNAQDKEEISKKHTPQALASFFFNTISGLQVVIRSTPSKNVLENIIEVSLSVLDKS